MTDRYTHEFPDGSKAHINGHLIEQRGITDEELSRIKALWSERWAINRNLESYLNQNHPEDAAYTEKMQQFVSSYEDVEFRLQDAWRFTRDLNYHRWFDIAGCTCPSMDNRETLGFSRRIYSAGCRVHGLLYIEPLTQEVQDPLLGWKRWRDPLAADIEFPSHRAVRHQHFFADEETGLGRFDVVEEPDRIYVYDVEAGKSYLGFIVWDTAVEFAQMKAKLYIFGD